MLWLLCTCEPIWAVTAEGVELIGADASMLAGLAQTLIDFNLTVIACEAQREVPFISGLQDVDT